MSPYTYYRLRPTDAPFPGDFEDQGLRFRPLTDCPGRATYRREWEQRGRMLDAWINEERPHWEAKRNRSERYYRKSA